MMCLSVPQRGIQDFVSTSLTQQSHKSLVFEVQVRLGSVSHVETDSDR